MYVCTTWTKLPGLPQYLDTVGSFLLPFILPILITHTTTTSQITRSPQKDNHG